MSDPRRALPSVDNVLQEAEVRGLVAARGRPVVVRAIRAVLDERRAAADPAGAGREPLLEDLRRQLAKTAPSLLPVINATGVVIHTNLGRAPLSEAAADHVAAIAGRYSNLEFDLERGERGDREVHAEARLQSLLGAEATLVVNNNAAAVLLAVNTFGEGREAIVSRGELVEIGGSFRIPDVLKKAGARLIEVGTTNRTRLADFQRAITAETGLLLKVHPSNFRVVGFTEETPLDQLIALARERSVPLVEDLGSGLIDALGAVSGEPLVADRLKAGVDVVTFSGDKLLGGPQAGLAAGKRDAIERMRRNPLYRALRVDKMTLAGLDVVLAEYEAGRARTTLPVPRMLSLDDASLRPRTVALAAAITGAGLAAEVVSGFSAVGGGASPTVALASPLIAITSSSHSPDELQALLRRSSPPVIARIAEGRLLLDLRTVFEDQDEALREAFLARGSKGAQR